MLSREQAYQKLIELVSNQNLIRHCLGVEAAMLEYAKKFNITDQKELEKWAVAGLIHDADWQAYPDKHPKVILEWLKEQGASEDIINAVASHGPDFGVEPKILMAKTLRAVDEVTGFIVAVALIKGKDLENVTVESITKKWKKKDFARGVDRAFVEQSIKDLGVELTDHFETVLTAMKKIKTKLGL